MTRAVCTATTSASAWTHSALACGSTTTSCLASPGSRLFQRDDEPHQEPFGRLGTHTAEALLADYTLDAQHFSVGNARDVAKRDLERPPVDDPVAYGTTQQAVMRIDQIGRAHV